MEVEFGDPDLDRLETDANFTAGRLQQVRAALDERDLYALKGLRVEKLKGGRSHQHSMRLNDQWRLIFELEGKGKEKVVHIVGIEDYH